MRIKILLVDDNENNLLSIESILWHDGYHLVKAKSGREALKILLKENDFTLILMDVEMPDINGFETATMIYQREKLRHIPVIFITAHSYGDENMFKGYRAGAVDYIYKPIQSELLRAKVSVFVELYKKNHQLLAQEQKLIAINKSLEIEIKDRINSEDKVNELNKKLLENIEQLEITNKELDQFAYMASHDLQEPIRKIRTFSDRLSSKFGSSLDEEGRQYMDKLQAACTRMQKLINDILAFSKISAAKNMRVKSDLNVIIEDVLTDMDAQVQSRNASIKIDRLPELPVYPLLVKSLFQNLINNAIKYSRKDIAPAIRISSKIDAQSNERLSVTDYCRIYVQDNGIGFEQEYADQIFTMFRRLHTSSEYEGTGIGLAMCKKIVEEHQGYITAKSAPGKGSTFIISLPLELEA